MRKKIAGILVCILVFSAFAGMTSSTKTSKNTLTEATADMDYSHTVFAELGSSTACKYCKYAHAALKNIYAGGWHLFYYVTLLTDNNLADQRLSHDYNYNGLPTVFFDGGYRVNVGAADTPTAQNAYNASIIECGNREVSDINLTLSVEWIGNASMDIDVSVQNNEATDYDGHIRVYITEISSSIWDDTAGYPYTFAFLDYAFNEDIHINPSSTWQNSTIWNGTEHDFEFITCNNVMVIAAVFNSEWHQGYAKPPSGNPFDAYYVDETNATSPPVESNPPDKPDIDGPRIGKVGVEYTYTAVTTDPDGDQMYYWFDWGDGTHSGWVGPYDSGTTANASHTWTYKGLYKIKVKAKDIYDVGSDLSDPLGIIMPKNRAVSILFLRFLEQHPNMFPILRHLLGL